MGNIKRKPRVRIDVDKEAHESLVSAFTAARDLIQNSGQAREDNPFHTVPTDKFAALKGRIARVEKTYMAIANEALAEIEEQRRRLEIPVIQEHERRKRRR